MVSLFKVIFANMKFRFVITTQWCTGLSFARVVYQLMVHHNNSYLDKCKA